MATEIFAKIGKPSYAFGPGGRVEVRSQGSDGKEKVELALFRLDGATVYFKAEGRTREDSLKAGIRQGKLILGTGFGMVAFSRK